MADVAASAGVSQGLPYRYFSDKDALIRALVTEAVEQADAKGAALALPGSAARRLRDLVTSMVEARRGQPELFLLFQHVVSNGDASGPARAHPGPGARRRGHDPAADKRGAGRWRGRPG